MLRVRRDHNLVSEPTMAEIERRLGEFASCCERLGVFVEEGSLITWRGVTIKVTEHWAGYIEGWAFGRRITPSVEAPTALDQVIEAL